MDNQALGKRNANKAVRAVGYAGSLLISGLFVLSGLVRDIHRDKPGIVREAGKGPMEAQPAKGHLTTNQFVRDIVTHPAFQGFGELLLPWDDNTRYYDTRLQDVASLMPYHNHVNPAVVVGALNRMIDDVAAQQRVFYEVYTDQQKQEDRAKTKTGLFFYRGKPGAPFAIVCPGGGFSYVGSLHEGFPLAEEISKKRLNAFVIRYRVGEQVATEDLAAAIAYIFRNAQTLGSAQKVILCGVGRQGPEWSAILR